MTPEQLSRSAAGIGLLVGIGALISPRLLVRLYGVDPDQMTGAGAFGWRLFAVRNIFIATKAFMGDPASREAVLLLQAPDQLVFAHAFKTRSIPRVTAVLAMISSGAVVATSLAARGDDQPPMS